MRFVGHRKAVAAALRAMAVLACGLAPVALPASEPGPLTHALQVEGLRVAFRVESIFPVDGSFGPVEGELRYAEEGGPMSGELRVQAATADTGYDLRDAVIRDEVLEAARHPSIVFRPKRWELRGRSATQLSGAIHGLIELHGLERPVTVALEARREPDGVLQVRCGFEVHFEEWGIENPGNEYLPVDPRVGVTVEGRVRARPLGAREGEAR